MLLQVVIPQIPLGQRELLGETNRSEMLISFGKEPLTWDVIEAAKKFLVGFISNKSGAETFDELRY